MHAYALKELFEALETKKVTSVELVEGYMEHIKNHDEYLNSLADINHHAPAMAAALDLEREAMASRGPLHGIPIAVKDNIMTQDTMRTTVNAQVFGDFYAPYDATIIKKLRAAGAIILAKANCSEFAYFMAMDKMPSGFGSMHGQVKHPYDRRIDPYGSSTGSAVAVAANLVPVSIGTETNGSLMSPAQQNGIVSVKPTLGLVSRYGIVPISFLQDTAGPLSRTVEDAATVLDIIKGRDENDPMTWSIPTQPTNFTAACHLPVEGLRIGVLNYDNHPNTEEEVTLLNEASRALEKTGAHTVPITFTYKLISNAKTLIHEFKRDLNAFLASLGSHAPAKSLLEIIRFNRENPNTRLPYGQSIFHAAQATSGTLKETTYLEARASLLASVQKFESLFKTHHIDAIMTTKVTGYAPIGGFPSIIVPAKPLKDLEPKSVLFIGPKWTEETLFALAHTYEQATRHFTSPTLKKE